MEARIALASVIVFGGVLAAGMLVSRADGGEDPSLQSADVSLGALVAEAPVDFAGTTSQGSDGSSPVRWDDDDRDDDDRYEDDDDWDDRYERDHDGDDDDEDEDRNDRDDRDEWDDDDD